MTTEEVSTFALLKETSLIASYRRNLSTRLGSWLLDDSRWFRGGRCPKVSGIFLLWSNTFGLRQEKCLRRQLDTYAFT